MLNADLMDVLSTENRLVADLRGVLCAGCQLVERFAC